MAVLFSLNLMLQILCIAKMHIYNISTMCIYNCCATFKTKTMKINKVGTVYFSFDTNENLKAFKEPNFIKWNDFQIENNKGTIYSEGKTLNVTLFLDSSEEFSIFKTNITPKKGINKIAVTWEPNRVSLAMNGEIIQTLNPNDFKF
jgi:hypothetical protein